MASKSSQDADGEQVPNSAPEPGEGLMDKSYGVE
jgi:hypothetical protein